MGHDHRASTVTANRVLRIITRLNIGGPAIHVGLLTQGLNPAWFDTTLAVGRSARGEGDMSAHVLGATARVVHLRWLQRPLHPLKDVVTWWQLAWLIYRWRPDVIHTHTAKAGALGRSAAWTVSALPGLRYRPVVIHTFHGHVLEGYFSRAAGRFFAMIERTLAACTHQLIAVSPAVKDDLVARRIAPASRICVIPLGLPLDALLQVEGPRRVWRTATEPTDMLMVWAGRLVPIKRPELFLDGLALVRRQHSHLRWRAIIAGDGELRAQVERAVTARGLAAHVRCVGWVRDMATLYADADLVCLTSLNEGTPVSIIEALAAGRPVVATAVGGVPDVLGIERSALAALGPGGYLSGQGGLLIRADDAAGFVAAVAACAMNPGLRRSLGQAGRAFVRERYAAGRLIRDIEQLYGKWLNKPLPASTEVSAACVS